MKAVQSSRMVPAIFIGRWTPKVLFSLKEKPYRHGQLRRHVGSVSQRMLIPQGRDCGRVTFASAPGAMSETWDLSLLRF